MRQATGLLIVLFTLLGAVDIMGQSKPVCTLLTSSEVGQALGAAGQSHESEMPVPGAAKGTTMKMCSWGLNTAQGGLHLSVAKMPPTASFDSLVAMSNQSYDALKAKGWTEERKDFGGIKCLQANPPGRNGSDPFTTNCMASAKGMVISAASLTKTPVPMERIKMLVDAAIGRL